MDNDFGSGGGLFWVLEIPTSYDCCECGCWRTAITGGKAVPVGTFLVVFLNFTDHGNAGSGSPDRINMLSPYFNNTSLFLATEKSNQ